MARICKTWRREEWIAASDNWERVRAAGLEDRVFPIHAAAHALPFADEFFDAAASLDAYHYFGTDDLYLEFYARFVKTGGQIGIVVPGVQREFADGLPPHLVPYWRREFWSFHSPGWWRERWERTGGGQCRGYAAARLATLADLAGGRRGTRVPHRRAGGGDVAG